MSGGEGIKTQTRHRKLPDVDHICRRADKSTDTSSKPTKQHLLIEWHHYTGPVDGLLRTFIDAETSHGICHLHRHHTSHITHNLVDINCSGMSHKVTSWNIHSLNSHFPIHYRFINVNLKKSSDITERPASVTMLSTVVCIMQTDKERKMLVNWTLTSPFSTNMAI